MNIVLPSSPLNPYDESPITLGSLFCSAMKGPPEKIFFSILMIGKNIQRRNHSVLPESPGVILFPWPITIIQSFLLSGFSVLLHTGDGDFGN